MSHVLVVVLIACNLALYHCYGRLINRDDNSFLGVGAFIGIAHPVTIICLARLLEHNGVEFKVYVSNGLLLSGIVIAALSWHRTKKKVL